MGAESATSSDFYDQGECQTPEEPEEIAMVVEGARSAHGGCMDEGRCAAAIFVFSKKSELEKMNNFTRFQIISSDVGQKDTQSYTS